MDRIDTKAGFYTRVVVDRARCGPSVFSMRGGHFEVNGATYGLGITLWSEDGYLETVEGFTYGEDLLSVSLADLRVLSFQPT